MQRGLLAFRFRRSDGGQVVKWGGRTITGLYRDSARTLRRVAIGVNAASGRHSCGDVDMRITLLGRGKSMPRKPPTVVVSDQIAFAVVDELIRTFVDHGDLTHAEAAAMLDRVINNVRALKFGAIDKAIPILEEMRREYRR